ncbi:MAG: FAD-binding oxidoreductase [Phycisphaerales bacterium]|nr:FAD-binding oxidoreductase [Phycisphaerales bacterium]
MTISHWRRSARPATIEREVVVIGGGICGVSAALHLAAAGVPAMVLERGAVASGASGRNAGFLMRGAADNYAAAVRAWGRDTARAVWRDTEENLAGLRREGIEALPSYRRAPSCLLALEPGELAELGESLRLLREDGFSAEWIERGDDSAWTGGAGALGGLVNPADGACNPWELMSYLASRLPAPVAEQQEVTGITDAGGGRVEVATPDARIICRHALVCTNAYTPLLLGSMRGVVTPHRGQMIALRAPGVRLDHSYYINHGSEYMRQAADGAVVVGGWRTYHAETEVGYADILTEAVQNGIEGFALRMLGTSRDVIARWSGVMGFTTGGLPIVAPVGGDWAAGAVWFCGGFNGHGMSMAYRAAEAATAAMVNNAPVPAHLRRDLGAQA